MATETYLGSHDFNGLRLGTLANAESTGLADEVEKLVRDGKLELLFAGVDENPAVKRFPARPGVDQISSLREHGLHDAWAYPAAAHLSNVVDRNKYTDTPFKLRVALGEPQLTFQAFDLLKDAYNSLRLLRTAFQQHPDVRPDEIPDPPDDDRTIRLE